MTTGASPDSAELYPIRTVSTLTGVNAITLRAWERRYGLIRPQRTAKGHRLYSRADVDLINRVVAMMDKGIAISQVQRALTLEEQSPDIAPAASTSPWPACRERMIAAITRFDEAALEALYNETLSVYPVDVVTRQLLLPLLTELGDRWVSARGSVAEEHFFGVYMRNKLGARFHHRSRTNTGPKLLTACLPGEQHEVGLLLFALAAHDRGHRLVLLGADMPLAELPLAARRARCDAIVLSSSIEPAPGLLKAELPRLVRAAGVPVFIGGLTSARHRDALTQAGAIALGEDVDQGLRRIRAVLDGAGSG